MVPAPTSATDLQEKGSYCDRANKTRRHDSKFRDTREKATKDSEIGKQVKVSVFAGMTVFINTNYRNSAHSARKQKRKSPHQSEQAFIIDPATTYFPTTESCSIIGSNRLNYRVRDGNGCDPADTITGKLR